MWIETADNDEYEKFVLTLVWYKKVFYKIKTGVCYLQFINKEK